MKKVVIGISIALSIIATISAVIAYLNSRGLEKTNNKYSYNFDDFDGDDINKIDINK